MLKWAKLLAIFVAPPIIVIALLVSVQPHQKPEAKGSAPQVTAPVSTEVPSEAEVRIADYTLALTAFTAVLAIATIGLWIETSLVGRRSDRNMRTLERAYMFAGPTVGDEGMAFDPIPDGHIRGMFTVLNLGKTPDFIRETYIRSQSVRDVSGEPAYPTTKEMPIFSDHPLEAGKEHRLSRMALDTTADSLMWGYVKYIDIFGKSHISRFCFVLEAKALRADPPFIFYKHHGPRAWNAWD